jgi:hypothetical protein
MSLIGLIVLFPLRDLIIAKAKVGKRDRCFDLGWLDIQVQIHNLATNDDFLLAMNHHHPFFIAINPNFDKGCVTLYSNPSI